MDDGDEDLNESVNLQLKLIESAITNKNNINIGFIEQINGELNTIQALIDKFGKFINDIKKKAEDIIIPGDILPEDNNSEDKDKGQYNNLEKCKNKLNSFSLDIIKLIKSMKLEDINETTNSIEKIKETLNELTSEHSIPDKVANSLPDKVANYIPNNEFSKTTQGKSDNAKNLFDRFGGGKGKRRVRKSKKNKKSSKRRRRRTKRG